MHRPPGLPTGMIIDLRTLAMAMVVLASVEVVAETQNSPGERAATKDQRVARAKERCRLNHGVDCDTPDGLKEWLLLERSRKEAVREGSRHLMPAQPSSQSSKN